MAHFETLFCACLIVLACSQNSPSNLLTMEDQGSLFKCQTRQEFVVELEANPSTGFAWQVSKSDPDHVRLLREETLPADRNRLGAPGRQMFFFQAMAIGRAPLKLEYRRPWEKDAEPAKTFSVTLVIHK